MDDIAADLVSPEFGEEAPTLRAAQRDLGLVRGISVLPLAASIVNSVVGVGFFTLPAVVALQAGAAAPAAYLATALARAKQAAIQTVAPGMIRAGQRRRVAFVFDADAGPAVAADIGQGTESAVVAAHDDRLLASELGQNIIA